MKPIGLGVIGMGGRSQGMINILQNGGGHLFELVAICDVLPGKLNWLREHYKLPASAAYADYREMLKNPAVEAVLVETGAQGMAGICCEAMYAGSHVMADVPMAFTRQDCMDLIAAKEKTGRVYCMAEQVRFANFVKRWKEHVEKGDIGEPLFIQGEYIHPEPYFYFEPNVEGAPGVRDIEDLERAARDPAYHKTWRNTFKHCIKYIPHELSPLLKIIGDRVVSVSCAVSDRRMFGDAVGMLDCECALMQTARGRAIRIVNSFTAPRRGKWSHHWYHIMGTDGVLETARPGWNKSPEFCASAEMMLDRNGEFLYTNYGWPRSDAPFGDPAKGHGGLEAFSYQQWHDAIRGGGTNELDVYNAVEAILPGIIAAESAEAGGVLMEVPDVRPGAPRPELDGKKRKPVARKAGKGRGHA